jgi:hypothetical protein
MAVPTRYILAAIAFGIAALGFWMLPTGADAFDCNGGACQQPRPPVCGSACHQPPPPQHCNRCTPPSIIVPPPNVPPPNIVVVNAGARASAQASATAIAVANARTGDTIIRQNMIVESGASAAVTSSAFAVSESALETETIARERQLLIQAICMDTSGNPHPASQTFGERDVPNGYRGEIYRCIAGTRMRATIDGRSFDCAQGEALWYENGNATCRPQIARRPCNERSLLRRYGAGEKMALIRDTETRQARRETTFNGAMTMDGGVGQSVW